MNKIIMLVVAFVLVSPVSAQADTTAAAAQAVGNRLTALDAKLNALDAAIAAGKCPKCAASLEVVKSDLAKLNALPDLRKGDRDALDALHRKVEGLEASLAGIAGQLAELGTLGTKIDALDRKVDAQTALSGNNAALTALTGINGVFDTGAIVASVNNGQATLADGDEAVKAALVCPTGYYADVSTDYKQSGRRLHANRHFTCKKAEVPTDALLPLPAPVVTSSRTTLGWVVSGVVGAAAFGGAGWYAGNAAKPVQVTDNGVKGGMGPPVAVIGALVGALVGAGAYALATQ